MTREILCSKGLLGISSDKSMIIMLICPLCRPIMYHPSFVSYYAIRIAK